MSKTGTNHIASSIAIFKQYKTLAEKAMAQLNDEDLFFQPNEESNSIYLIIKHLSGNMQSRWTDFMTSDGEKDWRNRDEEFNQQGQPSREEVMQLWEKGWQCLFDALSPLHEADLAAPIYIRSEAHSVMEAINRQIAHYSYHVGQIVFIAKIVVNTDWKTLSIAKGRSSDFNKRMNHLTK
ncbi:MAG: DUF1572 family protein [Bacteroidota bacterium]